MRNASSIQLPGAESGGILCLVTDGEPQLTVRGHPWVGGPGWSRETGWPAMVAYTFNSSTRWEFQDSQSFKTSKAS